MIIILTQQLIASTIEYLQKNVSHLLAVTYRHTGYDRTAAFSEAVSVLDLSSGELELGSEMIALVQQ